MTDARAIFGKNLTSGLGNYYFFFAAKVPIKVGNVGKNRVNSFIGAILLK